MPIVSARMLAVRGVLLGVLRIPRLGRCSGRGVRSVTMRSVGVIHRCRLRVVIASSAAHGRIAQWTLSGEDQIVTTLVAMNPAEWKIDPTIMNGRTIQRTSDAAEDPACEGPAVAATIATAGLYLDAKWRVYLLPDWICFARARCAATAGRTFSSSALSSAFWVPGISVLSSASSTVWWNVTSLSM